MAYNDSLANDAVVEYVKLEDVESLLRRYLASGPALEIITQLHTGVRKLPALEATLYSALVHVLVDSLGNQVDQMSQRVQALASLLHVNTQSVDGHSIERDSVLLGLRQLFSGLDPADARLRGIEFLLHEVTIVGTVLKIAADLESLGVDIRVDIEGLLENVAEKVASEVKELTEPEPQVPMLMLPAGTFDRLVDEIIRALVSSGVLLGTTENPVVSGVDLGPYARKALRAAFEGFVAIGK